MSTAAVHKDLTAVFSALHCHVTRLAFAHDFPRFASAIDIYFEF